MAIDELVKLEGHIVERTFQPGFVVLSYFISFLGAWTTLEIINRRTAMRGYYNWLYLISSAICMGGISIWCMHFIGNRAIILGDGQSQIQIAYNSGFTALSFFLPVIVLFMAFWAVGSNESINLTRVSLGSTLAGFGICGMHYLGQAGISNYDCVYVVAYVVGAGVIAVSASAGALGVFFLFRSSWDTSWWKRPICATLLAGAVSGMHWLASVGTSYRLRKADQGSTDDFSRTATVVVVIVLSILCCISLLGLTMFAQSRVTRSAKRAQQIVVTTAIFDSHGRLLVTPEGMLPTRKIAHAWIERTPDDVFSVSHPVFVWMFRTTRNWSGVSNLISVMRNHVIRAGIKGRIGSSSDNKLLKDEGSPIDDYSLVFRELFCVSAAELAADLGIPLERMGVLYDEIVSAGKVQNEKKGSKSQTTTSSSMADLERDTIGVPTVGKGQLLFLVNIVGRREAENLQASGYRFANLSHVVPNLAENLHMTPTSLTRRLEGMKEYAMELQTPEPGVHFACFAIRASMGSKGGFDVLVRRDAKNQLPTMQTPLDSLGDWHLDFLKQLDNFTVAATVKFLHKAAKLNNPDPNEQQFAKKLLTALEALKEEIEDPFFNDATLIAKPVEVPCRGPTENSPPATALVIAFKTIVPIHARAPGKKLFFVPLPFFKMYQHVYKNSPDHAAFARATYREFAHLLDLRPDSSEGRTSFSSSLFSGRVPSTATLRSTRNEVPMGQYTDMYGNAIDDKDRLSPYTAARGPSKIRFWDRENSHHNKITRETSSEKNLIDHDSSSSYLGNIMVSQEVSVDVGTEQKDQSSIEMKQFGQGPQANGSKGIVTEASKEEEQKTFVDTLFSATTAALMTRRM